VRLLWIAVMFVGQCDRWGSASQRAAGSTDGSVAPTQRSRDAPEALQLFCYDLLQDVTVQAQVRRQPLEFAGLFTQLAQAQSPYFFFHT
jgi:hypothetical protein